MVLCVGNIWGLHIKYEDMPMRIVTGVCTGSTSQKASSAFQQDRLIGFQKQGDVLTDGQYRVTLFVAVVDKNLVFANIDTVADDTAKEFPIADLSDKSDVV